MSSGVMAPGNDQGILTFFLVLFAVEENHLSTDLCTKTENAWIFAVHCWLCNYQCTRETSWCQVGSMGYVISTVIVWGVHCWLATLCPAGSWSQSNADQHKCQYLMPMGQAPILTLQFRTSVACLCCGFSYFRRSVTSTGSSATLGSVQSFLLSAPQPGSVFQLWLSMPDTVQDSESVKLISSTIWQWVSEISSTIYDLTVTVSHWVKSVQQSDSESVKSR